MGNKSSVSRIMLRPGAALFAALAIATIFVLPATSTAATAVGLGTASSYGVLAGAGVTNTGPSVIDGDLGTAPTPAVTGFGGAPNGTVNGTFGLTRVISGFAKSSASPSVVALTAPRPSAPVTTRFLATGLVAGSSGFTAPMNRS